MQLEVWNFDDQCLRQFIEHLKSDTDTQIGPWIKAQARKHLSLAENTNYLFAGLFYDLIQFPTFSRYLGEEIAHGDVRDSRPARNIAKFSRLLNKYEYLYNVIVLQPERIERDLTTLFNLFLRFLWDGGIDEYEDEAEYAPSGCVSLMTIHQSKGLEFPIVIVGSMDAVPRRQQSMVDDMLQAEFAAGQPFEPLDRVKTFDFWRLFYTAFSRAQNMLILTCQENTPKGRGQRNVPSEYFRPVYGPLQDWRSLTFDLSKVTLAKIKDTNLKQSYSFTSDILIYEACPQQYRFFKDLEFAPVRTNAIVFGTLVHQTIEDIHKAVLRGQATRSRRSKLIHGTLRCLPAAIGVLATYCALHAVYFLVMPGSFGHYWGQMLGGFQGFFQAEAIYGGGAHPSVLSLLSDGSSRLTGRSWPAIPIYMVGAAAILIDLLRLRQTRPRAAMVPLWGLGLLVVMPRLKPYAFGLGLVPLYLGAKALPPHRQALLLLISCVLPDVLRAAGDIKILGYGQLVALIGAYFIVRHSGDRQLPA